MYKFTYKVLCQWIPLGIRSFDKDVTKVKRKLWESFKEKNLCYKHDFDTTLSWMLICSFLSGLSSFFYNIRKITIPPKILFCSNCLPWGVNKLHLAVKIFDSALFKEHKRIAAFWAAIYIKKTKVLSQIPVRRKERFSLINFNFFSR